MRVLQPAEWSKPRGFSHGVEVDASGKWIVLAGQTGGDEKGEYALDMAGQVGTALKRVMRLLAEAGRFQHRAPDLVPDQPQNAVRAPASAQPGRNARAQFPAIDARSVTESSNVRPRSKSSTCQRHKDARASEDKGSPP
jgi:hypothetical protein